MKNLSLHHFFAALLLGASVPASHAVDNVYRNSPLFPTIPVWDPAGNNNWTLGAPPTALQNAVFPVIPGNSNAAAAGLRGDGTEIMISNGFGAAVGPIADNLIFQNSYKLTSTIPAASFLFGARSSFLTLRTGNVSVVADRYAILDTDVRLLGGTLTKLGEGTLIIDRNRVINGSVLVQEGTFGGTGSVQRDLTNSAIVAPGNSPGTLHVGGNYTQTDTGTLRIEIASADNLDHLDVGNKAKLDGDLDVSLLGSYRPKRGQKLTFLTAFIWVLTRGGSDSAWT